MYIMVLKYYFLFPSGMKHGPEMSMFFFIVLKIIRLKTEHVEMTFKHYHVGAEFIDISWAVYSLWLRPK